ncbi:MAG: nucleotidyl transferase AbiEii/AbiGii toxin family protein [Burkholderiaceae bacterium]
MTGELEVLGIVSERLTAADIDFMLTGSFAMAYYATPRMTRDLDLVIAAGKGDADRIVQVFSDDFYVDADNARSAIDARHMFNLLHLASGIKVDFIVKKDSAYRDEEFTRRQLVDLGGVRTWIAAREDLILSKLLWAMQSGSELQRRDATALAREPADWSYLTRWAETLGVGDALAKVRP